MSTSINPREIEHFAKDSGRWWDESGPFAILHRLNPLRMRYIKTQIEAHFSRGPEGLKTLDIGCGGGLVCEPLARMGATVTGLDADAQAVAVARNHAERQGLKINYIHGSVENILPASPPRRRGAGRTKTPDARLRGHDERLFDIVTALEIVEHVADMNSFIENAARLCKPGGLLIFSTLNRTPRSFALGIVAAEYILGWVPRGTHSWKKFIRPSELATLLRAHDAEPEDIAGYGFNPLPKDFEMTPNVSVNYFLTARKK